MSVIIRIGCLILRVTRLSTLEPENFNAFWVCLGVKFVFILSDPDIFCRNRNVFIIILYERNVL